MPKEILINVEPREKRVAIVADGQLEEYYMERPGDKTIVGNIYKGVIDAVVPAVGAAFVDIGLPKKGFLYLSEINEAFEFSDNNSFKQQKQIKKGQEVLVQVVKESFGTKGPRLSCHIGIAGRYIVLMPGQGQIGISRRIEDDKERRRLKDILQEQKLPKDVGFIVRTAAVGKSKQELARDAQFLLKLWSRIEKIINSQKAPSLVYEEYDLVFRAIRDSFTDDVSSLIVDSKPEFFRIIRFMKTFMSYLIRKVHLYKNQDLFGEKDVERQINRIFESRVYLKSKAYLIIEPTEGLVVIDVNSGGFTKNIGQEETAFRVNCDAAVEVARQLRLRDLGGIIVIDFIDMEKEDHRRKVLVALKNALSGDRAKYDILGISKFGVVEMTRERVHNTAQALSFQACPYCKGRGKIKSAPTTSIYALKELRRYLANTKDVKEVDLALNPEVTNELLKNREDVRFLEKKFHVKINLVSNPSLHLEDTKISS
ncbi:MAG: Rne/Rng family ribonuclease [Candidatus Omnitrophica bacterium]|jgi:ribonuclease G|nr:Rne/Rng family ribonuclease [Candidatus Omnitrophota bacterium]